MPARGSPAKSASPTRSTSHGTSKLGTTVSELYRGRAFLALLRDLALGEWTIAEIARSLDVRTADVAQFASEHADEISEVRNALAGQLAIETAGLWITHKENRLAELQGDFEDTQSQIHAIRSKDPTAYGEHGSGPGSKHHRELIKTRMTLLRAVAEELEPRSGQKTQTPGAEGTGVHYRIDFGEDISGSLS